MGWLTLGGVQIKGQSIVVGLDGSEHSQLALRWAADAAQLTGGEILAVHGVTQPIPQNFPADARRELLTNVHEQAAEHLEEWTLLLRKGPLRHRTFVIDDSPAEALLAIAKDEDAAMIVVGRRGLGGFARLLLGSVSHHLVQRSSVPVVVIPPSRET